MVLGFFTSFRMTGAEDEVDQDIAGESQQEDKRPVQPEQGNDQNRGESHYNENDPLDILNLGSLVPSPELHREHRYLTDKKKAQDEGQQWQEYRP